MNNIQDQLSQLMQKLKASEAQIEREKLFAEEAKLRFQSNLEAFKSFYPDIAKSIEGFQSDEPLELFVTQMGYGNIREHKSGMPLYGEAPVQQASDQVEKHLQNPFVTHIDFSKYADVPSSDRRLHARHLKELGKEVEDSGAYEKFSTLPTRFPTAVIFGIGLGYHLPILLGKVQFDYTFLIEPSFENFYCSLFCTDWKTIIERVDEQHGVLVFQLGASYQTFIDDLYSVSQDIGAFALTKCFCYQHYPSKDNAEMLSQFSQRLFEMHSGYGFYNDSTTSIAHTVRNANKGINLIKDYNKLNNQFSEYPVYVVGNGPSLDESLTFIKETQKKAVVIAAGTALQTLLKHDIVPDFHTLVERPKITYDNLLKSLPKDKYKNLNLLTLSLIYPDVVDLYEWVGMSGKGVDAGGDLLNYCRLHEQGKGLTYIPFCNPMVANTSLSYAVSLGFKQIYMFGVDNGYAADGTHHSKDSDYYTGPLKSIKVHEASHYLEGNFGGTVKTSSLLAISCRQMSRLLQSFLADDVECYNVGSGAKVEGALPLRADHLLPTFQDTDKASVVDYIKSDLFESFQSSKFEEYIHFEYYDELCNHLLEISQEAINSRAEALDNLRRQSRYLYSHRRSKYSHLHYVLEGELLYFHCPLISVLFSKEDEATSLENFKRCLNTWVDFLLEAKTDFKTAWLEKCTLSA